MSAPVCWACSCAQASDQEHFDRATVVFTGTVTGVRDARDARRWTFDVESVQKGGAAPELDVLTGTTGNTCAPDLKEGGRYQVFARRNDDGRLETTICDGTRSLDEDGEGGGEAFRGTVTPEPAATATPAVEERSRDELIERGSTSQAAAEASRDASRRSGFRRYAFVAGVMAVTAAAIWLVARRLRRRGAS